MSPRKPAVLRGDDGQNLREYLITAAARLIDQRGSAGLSVREIAREAQVADGALYNYFEDKEDLLAQALLAHVGAVMASAPLVPAAGSGTVQENLRFFIDRGLGVLTRVTPAFAGLLAQPKVLSRFHAMVGGDAAFGAAAEGHSEQAGRPAEGHGEQAGRPAEGHGEQAGRPAEGHGEQAGRPAEGHGAHADPAADQGTGQAEAGPRGLPESLTEYLHAERKLGRIDQAADVDAASTLIIGAIHGQVLPRVLFSPPGSPIVTPPGFAARLAETILRGIAPRSPQR